MTSDEEEPEVGGGVGVRFEDLVAWQKARSLAADVYRATGSGPLTRDFGLRDQLQRAAVSVMSNIAEGQERSTPADFVRFLWVAKASCAEVRSQLYVALDVGYLPDEMFRTLVCQAEEVGRIIGGLMNHVRQRDTAR